MSINITITDVTNLTDTERAVLRFVADPATADSLKGAVRGMCTGDGSDEALPEEVCSPHATVLDAPPAPPVTAAIRVGAPLTDRTAWQPAPASAELDSADLPWDKRIHASTRAKVADGTWRYMRGVDKALVEQVEAELRAVQAIPVPTAREAELSAFADAEEEAMRSNAEEAAARAATPERDPNTVDTFEVMPPAQTITIQSIAGTSVVPFPPVPAAPTAALPMTFAQLMQHITPMLVSGKLNQSILQSVVENCGLPHLAALGARPDLVETVRAAIDEAVGGAQ